MTVYTIEIWDTRDSGSDEPISQLREFTSLNEARRILRLYLAGANGPYIRRWEITDSTDSQVLVDSWSRS
jgi:hypothetical protein